jgi:hypothetical protein
MATAAMGCRCILTWSTTLQIITESSSGLNSSMMLWSLAQFAPNVPLTCPDDLAAAVLADPAMHTVDTLSSVMWSLSVLRRPDLATAHAAALAPLLAEEGVVESLKDSVLRKIFHAHLMAQHDGITLSLPDGVKYRGAASWLRAQSQGADVVHQRLRRLLGAFEVPCAVARRTEDSLMQVPFHVPRDGKVCTYRLVAF